MTRRSMALATLSMFAVAACTDAGRNPSGGGPTQADRTGITMVINAEVYTVDPTKPWAEAFAFDQDGLILAVGTRDEVSGQVRDEVEVIDAEGAMVLPGFQDPHVHVPEAGINAELCFLPPGLELSDYESLAADCAAEQSDADWVRAAGPSLFELRDPAALSATADLPIDVLDRAVPDRPVMILDDLGHAVWTNTLGLEAAGIDPDATDPQGGVFHRDPSTGRLTGLLLEDAQQLVRNAAAQNEEANYRGLLGALDQLAENGVTAVSDAGGYWAQGHPDAWWQALNEGTLTVRAANSLYVYPNLDPEDQLAEFRQRFVPRSGGDSDLLRFDTAKIYIDGIPDLGTAALLAPYEVPVDPLYPSGFRYFQDDQLQMYVSALHEMGYRVSFHAIGDAAVRDALDAVEAIDDAPEAITERRHRTTHTYLVDTEDMGRFAELGVVADFQQSADAIDPDYHEFLSGFIGEQAFDLIPTSQLLQANATVTLSSDWDAGPLPPLGTIQRSLTRTENAVPDLETALALSTIEAAYALGHDDRTGSITVGKYADFVMLDRNLFELDVDRIAGVNVVATYLAGARIY